MFRNVNEDRFSVNANGKHQVNKKEMSQIAHLRRFCFQFLNIAEKKKRTQFLIFDM